MKAVNDLLKRGGGSSGAWTEVRVAFESAELTNQKLFNVGETSGKLTGRPEERIGRQE